MMYTVHLIPLTMTRAPSTPLSVTSTLVTTGNTRGVHWHVFKSLVFTRLQPQRVTSVCFTLYGNKCIVYTYLHASVFSTLITPPAVFILVFVGVGVCTSHTLQI